jgi:sugar phosphate isomerase/epimerase
MMKYGIGTWAVRNYPYPQSCFVLDWAQAQGLDGVEIIDAWIDFYDMDHAELAKMKEEFVRRGLEIPAMCPTRVTLSEPELALANSARVERAIEVAEVLECPIINVSLSQTVAPYSSLDAEEHHHECMAQWLSKLADRAADVGIALSLELHEGTLVDVSDTLVKVLQMIDRPNVGANPDLGNWLAGFTVPQETWEEAITNLKPYTNYWHVKNFSRVYFRDLKVSRTIEVPLLWGDIDHRQVMRRMLAEPAYDGYIAIEVERSGDPFALMEPSIPYLKQIVAEVLP